ncbi:MAG: ATP-binding protein [Janthinobacterium lividum]
MSSSEQQLHDAQRQIEQLRGHIAALELQIEQRSAQARDSEEALRQAQKMQAVGQLTGGIAHDFNNILTGIIGSLEMMRRRIAKGRFDDLDELIEQGVSSAHRAANLTHRLLAFSRRQSLDAQPVELNALVAQMSGLLVRSLTPAIELSINGEPQLWTAVADANQVESALLNLVLNARDAMPCGGKLRVQTRNQRVDAAQPDAASNLRAGDYVVLSVTDNGGGMPQSVVDRAFDPFFTTKPIGQGSGLGLSMIYGFCKQSMGHVSIDSALGKGTTVNLFLPRGERMPAASTPVPRARAPKARDGESVLIVEDDPAVRKLVRSVLEEQGYHCLVAIDADSAQPIFSSDARIDLLISDVGLPGMNGRQLAEVGRHHRPGLKVLFITGYAEHAAVRDGFLGADMQMITKPFPFDLLTAKVHEMIG